MARGTATRVPTPNAYRGSLGRTQQTTVHITGPRGDLVAAQVYTTIDAVSDPELVERFHSDDAARALNVVRFEGAESVRVPVPVVYHDPAAELLVLVLGDAHRHAELDERIRVYERLRADPAPIPAYAKEFAVVYGAKGLRGYLEERAHKALESARKTEGTRDADRKRADLTAREGELERARAEHDRRTRELERRAVELEAAKADIASKSAEVERMHHELQRERAELERLRSEQRNRVIAAAQKSVAVEMSAEATTIGAPPTLASSTRAQRDDSVATKPVPKEEVDHIEASAQAPLNGRPAERPDSEGFESDIATGVVDALQVITEGEASAALAALPTSDAGIEFDEETTGGSSIIPQGSDPLTTDTHELPLDVVTDSWIDKAAQSPTSTFTVDGGVVRLALVVGEKIARGFGGMIDIRVMLHRTATYPVISMVIGPPPALRVPSPTQLAVLTLDIANDRDRQVLAALARKFEITVELVTRGRRIRRVKLVAPLDENIGFIMRAAEDHLRGIAAEGQQSPARARELVTGAGYDLLGTEQPDAAEFRDDKLAQLETAQQLRRAIAMARRFARPSREDYLVCTRGFPIPRWHELRRHVLESAVAWGLWMGPELAQVAVSEGLARSRRDLVLRLERGFEVLKKHPTAFDIDEEAAADNAKAIADEARALGVELKRDKNGTGAVKTSDEDVVASGSIGDKTPAKGSPKPKPTEELVALLEDRQHRLNAALELCDRADPRAAGPVIAAASKMSRAEAVRVLGMAVKFGAAARDPLLEGLASSKAFLRHGCALALALLRSEDCTQAVIDLLMTEPTEIWREVARAIGQVGPSALLPLASTFGRLGDQATPVASERVAWAMAHVAVRGGKAAVETMAGGQSVVAPVARKALELHAAAAKDHVRVRNGAEGSQAGRDVTVNRAFSRRFFEALEQGIPDAGQAGLVDLDASSPMEVLDEADLIDEDDEAELDESDLIQT